MKKALVCGAGGFLGHHLVKKLKEDGFWVRGVDLKKPEYSKSVADQFLILDLRIRKNCSKALTVVSGFDQVYQLAADRGGAGYMITGETNMMENNVLINTYMTSEAVKFKKKPKYFFSSSVCIYQDMSPKAETISEEKAYPALPENEYGWEKLYSERMLQSFGRKYKMPIRIARFHTTYGPESNWEGGREKAADALCRKVSLSSHGGSIEVWGNGEAVRVFTYVDDLIEGIRHLVESKIDQPTNIGSNQQVTVRELAQTIIKISGKKLSIKYIDGPVGVRGRNFSLKKIYSTGWRPKFSLERGIKIHYSWVNSQVKKRYGEK